MSESSELEALKRRIDNLPKSVTWRQLWDLRTEVSDLMRTAAPETQPVLKETYEGFTMLLKARAEELEREKEFAEADRLTRLQLETEPLRAELAAADTGIKVQQILRDPTRQKELAALDQVMEEMGSGANYLKKMRDATEASYRVATARKAGKRVGFKDVVLVWIERLRQAIGR